MTHEVSLAEFEGPLKELKQQCSGKNGRGRARFEEFKLWLKNVTILQLVTKVIAVGYKYPFIARERLVAANIGETGDNFNRVFMDKVELNVSAAELSVHRLGKKSSDGPILDELGVYAEILLAQFFELIQQQSNGQPGVLLTNGYANIAFIRGSDGNIWTVVARWSAVCRDWGIEAKDPDRGYYEGFQVISKASPRN